MFCKKKEKPEQKVKKPFDTITFDAFVEIIRNASGQACRQNEIPIKFQYLGVKYTRMLFRYKRDTNDKLIGVLFSLPQTNENKNMSCYVVGGADNAEEAIQSLRRFVDGKYA